MPPKTIYIGKDKEKDHYELLELLEKRTLSFSKWVELQTTQELKMEKLRQTPAAAMWRCYHPKIKLAQKSCGLDVCPMQDWSLGPVAKERVFAAAQPKCLFRIKP